MLEKNEKRPCMRCDADLVEVPKEDYMYPDFDGDGYSGSVMELKCPECGTYYSVSLPPEEERENYPAYNPDLEDGFVDGHHGYDGLCPICGHHIVWSGDFMRSEVWGDTATFDEDGNPLVDEWGCDVDDALVSYVACPYCGAYIEIVEAKPSEIKEFKKEK